MKGSPFRFLIYILIGLSLLWVDILKFPLLYPMAMVRGSKVRSLFKWWMDLEEGE